MSHQPSTLSLDGVDLAYAERGDGNETVVLSHSYLVDHRQFDHQIERLSRDYRVLAYDHREHGRSRLHDGGESRYELRDMVDDAIGFIEHTGAAPCHFIGLSTGGFVGLRIALERPELLRSLVLMATSAELEPPARRLKYGAMFQVLRILGYGPLMTSVQRIMFSPDTLRDPERDDEMALWRERMMANDRHALIRFGRAIFRRDSVAGRLGEIDLPTLVIVGEHDHAQPVPRARVMADGIPGARLEIVPHAGHLSTIDRPQEVSELLAGFLKSVSDPGASN